MEKESQTLEVQPKKEVEQKPESTSPGKVFMPATDIVETEKELLVYMDMPGVTKENLKIRLEKNILEVDGGIDSSPYTDLRPLYTEYNIGHFSRRFEVSNEIDQSSIKASVTDGVLVLTLPKVPERQPRYIQVN